MEVLKTTLLSLAVAVMGAPAPAAAASLRAETIAAWDTYVRATEARIASEVSRSDGFLARDFNRDGTARPLPRAGEMELVKVATAGADGRTIEVPDGIVHHWRGTVFIPNATLEQVMARVANPTPEDTAQEDVVSARVLAREPGSLRMFLRLQRQQIVTVVYNTEHTVRYSYHGAGRATSRSIATKIAEVADPDSPQERERPIGEDRGFLWRLNSYWRYQQVPGGVIVECESLSLSRSLPALVRGAVQPVIDSVARASLERTLSAMRTRLSRGPSLGD